MVHPVPLIVESQQSPPVFQQLHLVCQRLMPFHSAHTFPGYICSSGRNSACRFTAAGQELPSQAPA